MTSRQYGSLVTTVCKRLERDLFANYWEPISLTFDVIQAKSSKIAFLYSPKQQDTLKRRDTNISTFDWTNIGYTRNS